MTLPPEVQVIVDELGYSIKDTYNNWAILKHGVLGDLNICYANTTHYRIHGSMPPKVYVKAPCGINISKKKSPQKVANEIRIRYLSEYTPLWQKALEEQQEHTDYHNKINEKTQKLLQILPSASLRGSVENPEINIYMSKGENSIRLNPGRGWRIEGYLSDDTINHLLQYLKTKI